MDLERDLIETGDRMVSAMRDGDVDALDRLIDDEYRGCTIAGKIEGRDAILGAYGPGGARLDQYRTSETEVLISGEIGMISGRVYLSGHWGELLFEHDARFIDIYRRRSGGWRLYRSQGTEVAAGDDGQAEGSE
ncbi:MAG TPA: nuclear transport factor 2 family protein [Candidatus Krumholzibacterium sp.]|nr:nuclear transport factor 2 family protein [Candidatus Krumholzibacterium sp.]